MRTLSPSFLASLAVDATTLCRCWRLSRRDGLVLGFTDHDRDVTRGGTTFRAATGLDASEAQARLGLATGGGDVQGALDALSLTEADITAGLYDDASVEIWIVDWTDSAHAVLMDVATIGEIRRSEFTFVAELRSLAHRFDQERGRRFQRSCDADLGDARCDVPLSLPAYIAGGTVLAREGQGAVRVSLDRTVPSDFFSGGRFTATSGAHAGRVVSIRTQAVTLAGIVLMLATDDGLAVGDAFTAVAGCDKSPETCRAKFDNIANFRGFPHMPGNDVLLSYANSQSPVMDGGSLFR